MPIARVQAPDGRIIRLEVPEGATPEQMQAFVDQEAAAGRLGTPKPQSGLMASLRRGTANLISDFSTAWGGATGDANQAATEGVARDKKRGEADPSQVSWNAVAKKYNDPKGGLLSAAGEVARQVPHALAEQAPNLAAMAGTARLGAMAGSAIAPGPGTLIGGALGAFAPSAIQQFGGFLKSQAEEQQKNGQPVDVNVGKAALTAIPAGAIDVAASAIPLGGRLISKLTKIPEELLVKRSTAQLVKAADERLLEAVTKGTVKGIAVEVPGELAQHVLDRYQAGKSLTDADALADYGQTAYGTALLGPLGAAGRIHERGASRTQLAQIEEAKQVKAEQDAAAAAQQSEQQRVTKLQDPAGAAEVADRYQKAEATYRSMLPGKLPKGADEATKFEHDAKTAAAKDFLKTELQPLIKDYLVAKKTLQAQQPAAAAAPAPGTPPTPEEEAGLLFPLEKTDLQPPGPAIPTADEVEAQRVTLADQHQALDVHVESLRDQAAQAAQAGDTQRALQLSKQFQQATQARDAAAQKIAELPKAPKNTDLAKQLDTAKKALAKAGEAGDVDAIARQAAKIEKLKQQGAELMQPGPEMDMVPAGGKSESQAEFFPKVATDTLAPKPLQLPFDATKVAVPDRGQGPARLGYDPGTDVRSMEANRMDTSKTAQPDLLAGVPQRQQTVNDAEVDTKRPEVAPGGVEMSTKVQTGVGDVSTKSRPQLLADLQIARAAGNREAATEAIEGLRDLKAREEAERAKPGTDVSNPAGSQLATTIAGTRMPGNVAKQQAARDAVHRAYGNFVSLLNRFSKGLAKKEELDTARKQILDNMVDDVGVTRGLSLTAGEAQEVQSQAKQRLNELQTRFGDTRDVINQGTKDEPDMSPVQERDGTFIRDRIDRPQGTANVESRRPGRQTFDNPHAAAQAIKEELDQIRNNAINGTPGTPGVVGKQTPKTTSLEALDTAIAKAAASPLLDRLKDNLPAFAADPDRRNLAAEWLHKESIGQKNDAGAEVTAELDRLEGGKRGEIDTDPGVRRGLYNPGREGSSKTAGQGEMFDDKGILFTTWKEFDDYLASDAVQGVTATMSRLAKQLAPVEKKVAELRKNLEALRAKYAAVKDRQDAGAAQAAARIDVAQKKLQELIRDMVVTKMDPLYREAEEAQQALADVEARVVANMAKFAGKFSSGEYVTAATDTWNKAGAAFRAALADEMANGTDLDYFSAGPVIAAQKRKNDALVDLTQALLRDLEFMPESRQVLSFLNKDLALQLELQDAQGRVRQTRLFLEMAPATITKATLASPAGTALRKEISSAQRGDTPTAPVKGKTLSSLASLMKTAQETRGDALRSLGMQIDEVGTELDAAVAEIEAGMAPARAKAQDRVNPRRVEEDLQDKANAERKAENDRLERLADIPGEQVTFTDLAAVADKFAELPEKVAKLEAKAKDETLPKTTQAKAKNDAKKFRTRMETLHGLLSDDPEAVVAAKDAAQKQLDDVKARIDAKKQAINADGVTDKVRLSRTAELYDLRSELRDLQKFVDGFGKKVKRTPTVTRSEREVQRLWRGNESDEGTRLPASKQGPLMKKETVAGNVRTGDLTTVGERTLSPRNPITQSGQKKSPTSTQAQRGAAADTAYETAMIKLGKIEDLKERNDAALAKAEENNDPKLAKYQEFDARLTAALAAQQKVVDATVTGKRKAKAVTDIEVDDVTDTLKDYWGKKDAKPAPYRKLTEDEQKNKFGHTIYRTSTTTGPGMTTDAVTSAAKQATEGWTNTPETTVVATEADLPQHIQDQAARDGMTGKIPGLFDPDTGRVYLVAENLHTPKDVALTVVHEVAGHYGLRDMMGADYAPTMNRLYNGNEAIKAAADAKMAESPNLSREVAVEETLADMAESMPARTGPTKELVRAFYAIKSWFAKALGLKNVSDGEVRQIVANARAHVKRGTPNGGGPRGGAPVYRAAKGPTYASDNLFAKKKSFKERLQGQAALAAEAYAVDMRAPVARVLHTGDRKTAAQAMYYVRKNDHRMSNVYAVMQHGALGIRKDARGNRVIEAGHSKSVQDVFTAIGKIPGVNDVDKMQKAQIYLTSQRVLNNPQAAKALSLTPGAVANLQADVAKFQTDPDTMKALEHVRDVYGDLNKGMIRFLVDTGAMKKDEAARLIAANAYVPFYRVQDNGVADLVYDENQVIHLGDIRTQPYLQQLKEGNSAILPLNEAIARNVMLLTDLGMRNQTTRNVAYALQDIGRQAKVMQIAPGSGGADPGMLRFKQDGDEYHIKIDTTGTAAEAIPSDLLVRSVEGSHLVLPAFMKGLGWFSDVLRSGVTRNPMYVARQLFRDPFAASFTGGMDRGPLSAIARSITAFAHQSVSGPSKTAETLLRKGIVHSQIFSGGPEDLAKISLQLVSNDQGALAKLFSMMDRAAMRSDSVTREQVYEDVLARTGSEMEAENAASEMMDFQKRGLSPSIQYASRLIPFFNAQIQGLNVLVKAARGTASMQERLDIQRKFWDRAMMLAAGTLVYAAAMDDDDTYKNARPSDRYGNWFVPISRGEKPEDNVTLKLPIPFEVGLLFKALAEAVMDLMKGQAGEQEWKAMRNLFLQQIPGNGLPIPQGVKPIIELITNHSFFTGREIEGPGMSKLDPQERYTARTTELAKRLSETLPEAMRLSPVAIEHLVRGYFGSLPLMGSALVNEIFQSGTAVDRPTGKLNETPMVGVAFQDVHGGGPTDVLYAKIKAADQAKATYDKMVNEGRKQDALIYLQDIENLQTLPKLKDAEKKLQALAQKEKAVRNSPATPERKREALDVIAGQREKMSRQYIDAVAAVSR